MMPIPLTLGSAPWPSSRPLMALIVEVLPVIEDDLAADLIEHLALAIIDRDDELRAVRSIQSAVLAHSHAQDAENYLHIHRRTLANWRVLGKGPRYDRSGSRALYRQADLDAWLDAHTFAHSADERARRTGGGL